MVNVLPWGVFKSTSRDRVTSESKVLSNMQLCANGTQRWKHESECQIHNILTVQQFPTPRVHQMFYLLGRDVQQPHHTKSQPNNPTSTDLLTTYQPTTSTHLEVIQVATSPSPAPTSQRARMTHQTATVLWRVRTCLSKSDHKPMKQGSANANASAPA